MKILTKEDARRLATAWIQAWNSHDLVEIMSHYAEDVVLVSPTAAKLLADPSGNVKGKDAVRGYFSKGLDAYPNLRFDLLDIMWRISSIVVCYVNQKRTKTAEYMEIDSNRKITRVVANYNA
jgi:hypothetical protein